MFSTFEYLLKDGTVDTIEAENIYEAMEMLVRIERIHPTKIQSIKEK